MPGIVLGFDVADVGFSFEDLPVAVFDDVDDIRWSDWGIVEF